MMTIFSIPKAFTNTSNLIQRNAIGSWRRLVPECEIMLFGADAGVQEYASEIGARWMEELPRNRSGTPLLQPAFEQAQKYAKHGIVCYVNADIIILNDLVHAVTRAIGRSRLLVGQRVNIKVDYPIFSAGEDWELKLRDLADTTGQLHGPSAMDYFVFRRNELPVDLTDFVVGRPAWDNWVVMQARRNRMKVVDLTEVATVLHQEHGYSHVPDSSGSRWEGPEASHHLHILRDQAFHFDTWDATHRLTATGVKRALSPRYLANRIISETALLCRPRPLLRPMVWSCGKARALLNIIRPIVFGVSVDP